MKLVVAGASGFLGTAWRDHLAAAGHEVVRLVRGEALSDGESHWDPSAGQVDRSVVEGADVVANLAGAPLAHWPWTAAYQRTFTDSRVATTRTLAEAVASSDRRPALLAQSGVAGYGDRGDLAVGEDQPIDADTFMGGVVRQWEAATGAAAAAGARVAVMRTGVVLDRRGGALRPQLLQFRAGLGGPVGSGDQYLATISLLDWVRAATFLAEREDASGPYNLTGPGATTNAEYAHELARLVHRPSAVPVPAFVLRTLAGTVSSELLNSTRVEPVRLLAEGFTFEHSTLGSRLQAALS
ncbi:MAG TPA: TIGR01777 family oxidoreductase [Nocardioidaceae bacterium]|nr:TIGR01777 family oxidoreductase [Nocardioidaceae bacterium]